MGKVFFAGIILYNPQNELFVESVKLLVDFGITVIIYDNSTIDSFIINNEKRINETFGEKVVLLKSKSGNAGLGLPFNEIVKKAIATHNCKGIFFFDQDSEVNHKALISLTSSFHEIEKRQNFGIIAGCPIRRNGNPYRLRKRNGLFSSKSNLIPVDQVPSSFSLIPISTFNKIGFFHEDFFIDHIDMDFSMRCWDNNLAIYVDKNAKFIHEVGVGDVIFLKKRLFPISDAYRHYYQIRNLILSLKRNNKKGWFFLKEILIRIVVVFVISIYAGNFFERLKYLIKGMRDGFKGVSGKLT